MDTYFSSNLSEYGISKGVTGCHMPHLSLPGAQAQGQDSDGTLDSYLNQVKSHFALRFDVAWVGQMVEVLVLLAGYGRAQRQGTIVDNFNKSVSEEAATAQRKTNACQKWCAKIMKSQAAEVGQNEDAVNYTL